MGATPYEAIDILVTKLMDLDATDAVILGRDIEQALTTVTQWLDAQPGVREARKFNMLMRSYGGSTTR